MIALPWVLVWTVIATHIWTSAAVGYTGGPVRAEITGYDPTEKKVYYRLTAFDESGEGSRVFYSDLANASRSRPVRTRSLEQPSAFDSSAVVGQRWSDLAKRLVPLRKKPDLHIDMKAQLDSLRVDPSWGETVYRCRVELRVGELRGSLQDTVFCRPVVHHDGPYQIPGRPEMISVVSFIGRAYGCELVDVPVLLTSQSREKAETRSSHASGGNQAPAASVPANLEMSIGEPVQLAGEFSDPNPGDSLTVSVEGYPPGLFPVNGNQAGGAKEVRLYGIPDRSIAPGQDYSIEWSVSDGESSRTATSDLHVQDAEPAPDLASTMAKYLTAQHFDGMSRLQVRKFGTQALPILAQMLRDERYKGIWHRIAGAIGFIGDIAYFDTLHAFIWDRFQGEVDYPTYMAIQSAQACLNAMATVSPRVLSYLVQTVDPAAWGDLRWSVQPYSARHGKGSP